MSGGRAALGRQSVRSPQAERTQHGNMCLSQPHPEAQPLPLPLPPTLLAEPTVRDADDAKAFSATLDAMAARRPAWTLRGVFKQPAASSRPGLPRRFHSKINLNDYWGALEKVVKVRVSWPRPGPAEDGVAKLGDAEHPVSDAAAMDVDNEVNENLANERAEQSKMDVDVVEVKVTPPASPVKVVEVVAAPPAKRVKGRRRSAPTVAAPDSPRPCGTPPSPCGAPAPSPCRRTPLGTLNGMSSRGHLAKSLSPLSAFADNLARRLARQH